MTGKLKKLIRVESSTLLRISAVLTIVGLIFMLWSMLDPTPWPVLLAMSVGQLFGTLAFALYGLAILQDLLRVRRARREAAEAPATVATVATADKPAEAPPP